MDLTLHSLTEERVHLLGIGGIGVSALARLLSATGVRVSGCDVRESTITRALRQEGIGVKIGHDPSHVDDSDVLVYSTAIPDGNREFEYARRSGKPVLHRSQLLALLLDAHIGIGVTGTNGKGTVSAMITWILKTAALNPSYYIGGLCPNLESNAFYSRGRHMVAELDESDGSLLNVRPKLALINNVELDHLNYYKSFEQVLSTLHAFCSNLPDGAHCFFNQDDKGSMAVAARLTGTKKTFFGASREADYFFLPVSVRDRNSLFSVYANRAGSTEPLGEFELNVPGSYNIENAIGAIAVASELGVEPDVIREALSTFCGLENRYTVLPAGERKVIKDYMSHPTGMRKVLQTARLGEPGRLVAVFKPYRYTMIRYHAENYARALSLADEIIITEMWEADEEPIPGVDTPWLVEQLRSAGVNVTYIEKMEGIADHLLATAGRGDCVVFFGGNDLFEIADTVHQRYGGLVNE